MSRPLQAAFFQIDVTPPMGASLCNSGVKPACGVDDPLTARGVVLLTEPEPVVLCTVDWVGIGNASYETWRSKLALAAGTSRNRVCVHTVHQHDAPGHDASAQALLDLVGLPDRIHPAAFCEQAVDRAADALRTAMRAPVTVTHIGAGQGEVCQVASNRRLLGSDGKVQHMRLSKCLVPAVRAAPEGVIDPMMRAVTLYHHDEPIGCLTWYATHPQSYYGQGRVSCDFPGLARSLREQALPGVWHIHFTGAAGNVAAGKYNDGSPELRPVLAQRLAEGMGRAFDDAGAHRQAVDASSADFRVHPLVLPVWDAFDEQALVRTLCDPQEPPTARTRAARHLAWIRRHACGHWPVELTRLQIGRACMVSTPGELFVEYQLAAQQLRPDDIVCLAAYGDYAPGYLCTAVAHEQGGYEPTASRTGPGVEPVMTQALKSLLR